MSGIAGIIRKSVAAQQPPASVGTAATKPAPPTKTPTPQPGTPAATAHAGRASTTAAATAAQEVATTAAASAGRSPSPVRPTDDTNRSSSGRGGTDDAKRGGSSTTPAGGVVGGVIGAIEGAIGTVVDKAKGPFGSIIDKVQKHIENEKIIDEATEIIQSSPTGAKLWEETVGDGVEIIISTDADYAHYDDSRGKDGTIVIHPDAIKDPLQLAGVLAHELGHAYVDHAGIEHELDDLPDKLGTVGDEIVAETVASAIIEEAGYVRGESSISHGDGTYRTPSEGLDQILTTGYVDYYDIDLSAITTQERAAAADVLTQQSIDIITALGGTPPPWVYGS